MQTWAIKGPVLVQNSPFDDMTWHNVMLYSQSQKHGYNWVSLFWVNIKIYITKLLLFLRTPLQDACGQKCEGASDTLRGSKAQPEMKLAQISNTGERCSFQFVKCHWSEMFPRAVMPYNFPYLIFVIFFTQPQFATWKFYTWKCVNLAQKLPRDKTA